MIDWGNKVITEANEWHENIRQFGFSRIPNALFEYAGVLELSHGELGILVLLLSHMRYTNLDTGSHTKIYPSMVRLSEYKINVSYKTLWNIKNSLEKKGLLRTNQISDNGNLEYDFCGLFALLNYLVQKDVELKNMLDYELKDGNISDRIEADKIRFSRLKAYLKAKKKELGI